MIGIKELRNFMSVRRRRIELPHYVTASRII